MKPKPNLLTGPRKLLLSVALWITSQADVLEIQLSTNRVSEAELAQPIFATVTVNDPADSDRTILIVSPSPTKLSVPSSVTLPAGLTAATFPVDTINNGEVDGTLSYSLRVAMEEFEPVVTTIQVDDDDTSSGIRNEGTIGGKLSGPLSPGRYLVTKSIVIEPGVSWSLGSETQLEFRGGIGLTNRGVLVGIGSVTAPIRFVVASNSPTATWNGITVMSSGQGLSHLEQVELSDAANGLQIIPEGNQPSFIMRHSVVHGCTNSGIVVHANRGITISPGSVEISSNQVYGNGRTGVVVSGASWQCQVARNGAHIINNDIAANVFDGISLNSDAAERNGCVPPARGTVNALVTGNYIHANGRYGMWCKADVGIGGRFITISRQAGIIQNNRIQGNAQGGIWMDGDGSEMFVDIINNSIVGNGGAGISHDSTSTNRFRIVNNVLVDNTQGIFARGVFPVPDGVLVAANDVWRNNDDWVNYPEAYGGSTGQNARGVPADGQMNISVDPGFVAGLQLSAASLLIDSGVTNGAPALDFSGQARFGLPDLGWDEIAPVLWFPSLSSGEGVTFEMEIPIGYAAVVESSTNLVSWELLTNVEASPVTRRIIGQAGAAGRPSEYFRARLP